MFDHIYIYIYIYIIWVIVRVIHSMPDFGTLRVSFPGFNWGSFGFMMIARIITDNIDIITANAQLREV